MGFKSFLTHSSLVNNLIKQNFLQSFGLQSCPSRLSSSVYSPFSLSNVSSKLSLQLSPVSSSSLFSQSIQPKLNYLSIRFRTDFTLTDDDEVFPDIIYEDLTVDKFKELIKKEGDDQLISEILADYEYVKFETGDVPSTIKMNHMYELMKMVPNERPTSFKFLADKEKFLKSRKLRKSSFPKSVTFTEIQKIIDDGETPQLGLVFDPKTGAPVYGEWLNSHFVRIRQYEYRRSFVKNLLTSQLFGQRLIIDCDYTYSVIDAKRIAHDIQKAFAQNRNSIEPFNLTLTGVKSQMLRDLLKVYSISFTPTDNLGIDTYSEPFTEIFADQKLIYLSPHAKSLLTEFDHEAIYILGGLTSKVLDPLSFKKAMAYKIPTYRFPTDFLPFRPMKSAKSFDLTETTKIMLKFKETSDIEEAVKYGVSFGRLKTPEEIEEEQRKRLNKLIANQRRAKKSKTQKLVP